VDHHAIMIAEHDLAGPPPVRQPGFDHRAGHGGCQACRGGPGTLVFARRLATAARRRASSRRLPGETRPRGPLLQTAPPDDEQDGTTGHAMVLPGLPAASYEYQ
jgi:hypothetical protein